MTQLEKRKKVELSYHPFNTATDSFFAFSLSLSDFFHYTFYMKAFLVLWHFFDLYFQLKASYYWWDVRIYLVSLYFTSTLWYMSTNITRYCVLKEQTEKITPKSSPCHQGIASTTTVSKTSHYKTTNFRLLYRQVGKSLK